MTSFDTPIRTLLPPEVKARIAGLGVLQVEFAAGPGFVVRQHRTFDPPAPFHRASAWLERYRGIWRGAAARLEDGSVLWFTPDAFSAHDPDDRRLREAGATLRTRQGAVRLSLGGMKSNETSLRAPFPRSWWVEDGALLAGCYPGARDADGARRQLSALLDFGVAAVVNLMEEGETDHDWAPFRPYEEELRRLADERDREGGVAGQGLLCARFPIPDMGVPSRERMRETLDWIDARTAEDRIVYVHCWGGRGRTGTVAGCHLARHGIAAGEAALERIRQLRCGQPDRDRSSPETEAQQRFVREWPEGR